MNTIKFKPYINVCYHKVLWRMLIETTDFLFGFLKQCVTRSFQGSDMSSIILSYEISLSVCSLNNVFKWFCHVVFCCAKYSCLSTLVWLNFTKNYFTSNQFFFSSLCWALNSLFNFFPDQTYLNNSQKYDNQRCVCVSGRDGSQFWNVSLKRESYEIHFAERKLR